MPLLGHFRFLLGLRHSRSLSSSTFRSPFSVRIILSKDRSKRSSPRGLAVLRITLRLEMISFTRFIRTALLSFLIADLPCSFILPLKGTPTLSSPSLVGTLWTVTRVFVSALCFIVASSCSVSSSSPLAFNSANIGFALYPLSPLYHIFISL